MGLSLAILTVSDTRTLENDSSGQYLLDAATQAGHQIAAREICVDDIYMIRAKLSQWIAEDGVQAIICTGGTGITQRDVTPEAMRVLFDKPIEGFGELFRQLSYADIGSSTIQSRAIAGVANRTLLFALPGSTGACRLAWESILQNQLDESFRPCNFVKLLPRL